MIALLKKKFGFERFIFSANIKEMGLSQGKNQNYRLYLCLFIMITDNGQCSS